MSFLLKKKFTEGHPFSREQDAAQPQQGFPVRNITRATRRAPRQRKICSCSEIGKKELGLILVELYDSARTYFERN